MPTEGVLREPSMAAAEARGVHGAHVAHVTHAMHGAQASHGAHGAPECRTSAPQRTGTGRL